MGGSATLKHPHFLGCFLRLNLTKPSLLDTLLLFLLFNLDA